MIRYLWSRFCALCFWLVPEHPNTALTKFFRDQEKKL